MLLVFLLDRCSLWLWFPLLLLLLRSWVAIHLGFQSNLSQHCGRHLWLPGWSSLCLLCSDSKTGPVVAISSQTRCFKKDSEVRNMQEMWIHMDNKTRGIKKPKMKHCISRNTYAIEALLFKKKSPRKLCSESKMRQTSRGKNWNSLITFCTHSQGELLSLQHPAH